MTAQKTAIKIEVEDSDNDKPSAKKKASTASKAKKASSKSSKAKIVKKFVPKIVSKKNIAKKVVINKPIKTKINVQDEELGAIKAKLEAGLEIDKKIITRQKDMGRETVVAVANSIAQDKMSQKDIKPPLNLDKETTAFTGAGDIVRDTVKQEQDKEQFVEEEKLLSQKIRSRRSIKLYRRIAYFFITITVLLVAVVSYFTFVKVTIVLIPNQERISNNMIFDIYDKDKPEIANTNAIIGVVRLVEISQEKEYESSGTEVIGKEAIGRATIVNNYIKNQPLVATTRLLSADGKLFRLKETIDVPAGGSIEVEIYADEPSPEMAIESTKFTIPGLWAGLQDKIYAQSNKAVVYQQKVKKHITIDDIENTKRDLKQQLLSAAKDEINENYKEYEQILYKIDENSIKSSVVGEVGDEINNFSASMNADVVVVAFNDKTASDLAKQKFVSSLSENRELISFDEDNIIYSLNNYDYSEGLATVNATFEGKISLKEGSNVIEVEKLLGLNSAQLDTYLLELPEIAGFEVKYTPSFIKRVPNLIDRIDVQIKK